MTGLTHPLPQPTLDLQPALPQVVLNNYAFHCQRWGPATAPPLLVLHGGPGGDFHYLLALKQLAPQLQVIFFDQRGSGLSPRKAGKSLQLQQYIADVDAFVEYFTNDHPFYLLGHSWGAFLALQYVAKFPHKISKLVLAEPFVPSLSLNARIVLHNLRKGILKKLYRALRESQQVPTIDPWARADYFYAYLLHEANPGYHCPTLKPQAKILRASLKAFLQLSFSVSSLFVQRPLSNIPYPTEKMLVLSGLCNCVYGTHYLSQLLNKLQQPLHISIPQAGHFLFTDQPQACLSAVESFLLQQGEERTN